MAKPKNDESKLSKAIRKHMKPENYDDSKSLYKAMRKYGFEDKPNFYNNSGRLVNAKGIYNQNDIANAIKYAGIDLALAGVGDLLGEAIKKIINTSKNKSVKKELEALIKKASKGKVKESETSIIGDKKIDINVKNKPMNFGKEELPDNLKKLIKLKKKQYNYADKLKTINKLLEEEIKPQSVKDLDYIPKQKNKLKKYKAKLEGKIKSIDDDINKEYRSLYKNNGNPTMYGRLLNKVNPELDAVIKDQTFSLRLNEIVNNIYNNAVDGVYKLSKDDIKNLNKLRNNIIDSIHTSSGNELVNSGNKVLEQIDNLLKYTDEKDSNKLKGELFGEVLDETDDVTSYAKPKLGEDTKKLLNAEARQQVRDKLVKDVIKDTGKTAANIGVGSTVRDIGSSIGRLNYKPKPSTSAKLLSFGFGLIPIVGNSISDNIINNDIANQYENKAITSYFVKKASKNYNHPNLNAITSFESIPDNELSADELELRNKIKEETVNKMNEFNDLYAEDFYNYVLDKKKWYDNNIGNKNFDKNNPEHLKQIEDLTTKYDLLDDIYKSNISFFKNLAKDKGYYNEERNTWTWN